MDSSESSNRYYRYLLDDALAGADISRSNPLLLDDGTIFTRFRDAMICALQGTNGERPALCTALTKRLSPCSVVEEMGNEPTWRSCYRDILQPTN